MPYTLEVHTIQAMKFRQLPTTQANIEKVQALVDGETGELEGLTEPEQNLALLKYITEPVGDATYEEIDPKHLDIKHVEYILQSFFPMLSALMNAPK